MASMRKTATSSITPLEAFLACCQKHISYLINQVLHQVPNAPSDLLTIVDALEHEKNTAGNLAGLLDVQLIAGIWSVGRTSFAEKLTQSDIEEINARLNAIPDKRNFSEDDLRIILEDVLLKKFQEYVISFDTDVTRQKVLIDQFHVVTKIAMILEDCLENQDDGIIKHDLRELFHVIHDNQSLLGCLTMTSNRLTLFGRGDNFLSQAKQQLDEVVLASFHHRAS